MKNILILIFSLFAVMAFGQAPALINYQGVARNAVGNVLPNKNITVRLSVHDVNANGAIVYSEVRTLRTNSFGMFTIQVGSTGATSSTGSLAGVNWKSGDKFLQVEIDPAGGWNYQDMGTSRLLSVPYAMHANSATPTGPAGGILSGSYPNPTIANGSITGAMLAPGTGITPTGTAGGDLRGNYPSPMIANDAITAIKIADNAVVSSKIANGSITSLKLAPGIIPSALPPIGSAGGDLKGNFPNPLVSRIQGIPISTSTPSNGQVLKFNGTQWAPAADNTGGGGGGGNSFNLPYSGSENSASGIFSISNQGIGASLEGINLSSASNAVGILGRISSPTAGAGSVGIRGINSGTSIDGIGIWGSHNGFGKGVYGTSVSGNGVHGFSVDGAGIFGSSTNHSAAQFDISNPANASDVIFAYTVGLGTATTAISEQGNGLWGITYSPTAAGVLGYNTAGGEAIVGQNSSDVAAAVVGKNNGTFAGVQGIAGADFGIGVHALANQSGTANGTALVAELEGSSIGNTAVFKANGNKVARIDQNGKGFFNGGTQVGGADLAEYFEVEGSRQAYEAGDVLIISQQSDRKVEQSTMPYSTLVAGVYATKPGLLLTEKNATEDELSDMVPMGVIGVIPTKVCTEGGSIRRGDLIVTSSIRGVAMRADPEKVKVGQVIGKALQDYNGEGTGKINVLVSIK